MSLSTRRSRLEQTRPNASSALIGGGLALAASPAKAGAYRAPVIRILTMLTKKANENASAF
jgi:hypothetical protein